MVNRILLFVNFLNLFLYFRLLCLNLICSKNKGLNIGSYLFYTLRIEIVFSYLAKYLFILHIIIKISRSILSSSNIAFLYKNLMLFLSNLLFGPIYLNFFEFICYFLFKFGPFH